MRIEVALDGRKLAAWMKRVVRDKDKRLVLLPKQYGNSRRLSYVEEALVLAIKAQVRR